jgi:GNAT superfamily N-acetyltransferase
VFKLWEEMTEYHRKISGIEYDFVKNYVELWIKYYEHNVRSRNRKAIVAEEDGRIIGYILGQIQERPPIFKTKYRAFITDAAVTKKKQHKGVGTLLLKAFEDWAREKNVKYIGLGVVSENKLGRSFWDKQGFSTILLKKRKTL